MLRSLLLILVVVIGVGIPTAAHASVYISEIMYDLEEGSDTGREWIEIYNDGSTAVDLTNWKFVEGTSNHGLVSASENFSLPAQTSAVIVQDTAKFSADWPSFGGLMFDSSWSSLNNSGETVGLKDANGEAVDSVSYTGAQGGGGNGFSLQKINGMWREGTPTPGDAPSGENANVSLPPSSSSSSYTTGGSSQSSTVNTSQTDAQIRTRMFVDQPGTVGTGILFRGEVVGVKKETIDSARYTWNFGDGEMTEGEQVTHSYSFPGEYIVVLDAAYGKYNATSRIRVKVVEATLSFFISTTSPRIATLQNKSADDLNISRWILRRGSSTFTFPKNSLISARGRIQLPIKVLGFEPDYETTLLYPNNDVAVSRPERPVPIVSVARVENSESSSTATPIVTSVQPMMQKSAAKAVPMIKKIEPIKVVALSTTPQQEEVMMNPKIANAAGAISPGKSEVVLSQTFLQTKWLFALGGIIVLGLAGLLLRKKKTIADDIEIV